jgi:hypothetical protein
MKNKLFWCVFTSVFIATFSLVGQPSLQLPITGTRALDNSFSNWTLINHSTPLYGDEAENIFYWGKPFYKCDLNRDTIPDFAFGITVEEDSSLTVHFVALVSNKDSFSLFILGTYRNPRPLMVYLYLYPKGDAIANYGWDDEQNVPESLLRTWNRDELVSQFDADSISLHRTDKNWCDAFVFEMGRFWSFESCD